MAEPKAKTPFSPKTERILTLVQALFPIIAGIATALWAVNGYISEQQKNRSQDEASQRTRLTEARKPFLELQLKTYTAAAEVAGRLASIQDTADKDWQDAKRRFYALYWSELSLVEDQAVEGRMVKLEHALDEFYKDGSKRAGVQQQVLCLAIELKASIASGWQIDPGFKTPKREEAIQKCRD
jgi:hypothetical protein